MKKLFALILAVLMTISVGSLVGCSPDNNEGVTVTDLAGDQVTLPTEINTIATTSNSSTNMIIAFGGGDKLVSAYKTFFDNPWVAYFYPKVTSLTKFDSYLPEVENLLAMNVDLFIASSADAARSLRSKGLCSIYLNFFSVEDIKTSASIIGEILGDSARAEITNWLSYFDNSITECQSLLGQIDDSQKPVVYEIIGDKYRGLFRTNYGEGSKWIEYAGGNIATKEFGNAYITGNAPTEEAILAKNPDHIFIGGTYSSKLYDDVFADVKWGNITAVKEDRVHIIPVGCDFWNGMGMEYPLLNYYAFSCLYPEKVNYSMATLAHDFYLEYYGVDFTDEQIDNMLKSLAPDGTKICE